MLPARSLCDDQPFPRWVGRWLERPVRSTALGILFLGLLPLVAFLVVGVVERSLVLPWPADRSISGLLKSVEILGKGERGLFEDLIFVSDFVIFPLFLVLVGPAYRAVARALADSPHYLADAARGLSDESVAALRTYLGSLLRGEAAPLPGTCGAELGRLGVGDARRWLRAFPKIAFVGGFLFFAFGTRQHYLAESVYGFPIWADRHHPVGFAARSLYELVLYAGVVPVVATALLRLLYVVGRLPRVLERERAIRFVPHPSDGGGHLGAYGVACLRVTALLAPILLPVLIYFFTYPPTPVLVAGVLILLVALPSVTLLPLLSIHRVLKCLRRDELLVLGRDLDRLYGDVKSALPTYDLASNPKEVQSALEALSEARGIYLHVFDSHTWPYRRAVLAAVITATTVLFSSVFAKLFG